jgi:myxalamid-type polyketide synthase MxaB
VKPDVSYFLVDLIEVTQQQPDLIQSMLQQLLQQFQLFTLKPLPCQVFSSNSVVDAFRHMQQAKHIGKIVISQNPVRTNDVRNNITIRPDGTYLITGGLGGLGLQIASRMVEKGAKHLILVGRSAPSQTAQETISQLEKVGAKVSVVRADISNPDDVAKIIASYQKSEVESKNETDNGKKGARHAPLKGIVHAAGILDDGVLMEQSSEKFDRVMAPKVQGAWNLHLATQNITLDFFVMFSSAASLLGSAGQANYCAANAFLDALAHYRRSQGLPGTSINWGTWENAGMTARLTEQERSRLTQQGMCTIVHIIGLQILEEILDRDLTQIGVLPIDWSVFIEQFSNDLSLSFFEKVTEKIQNKSELLQQLELATTSDRIQILISHLRTQIAKILGIKSSEAIDIEQGLTELGMDSLSSVELRNKLQTDLQCSLPSTLIFDYPNINAIANYLNQKLFALNSDNSAESSGNVDFASAQVQDLSEEEAEAMLLEELEKIMPDEI